MKIQYVTLESVASATGVVVAIDVCRAFTTAAFAFAAGAERILLAGTVEEAFALKSQISGARVMGEVGGKPVTGFDFWNSPAQFANINLAGQTLIQRTTAGTQGIVRAVHADQLLAASFVVARATARAIQKLGPRQVTFVLTGVYKQDPAAGREDEACADYLSALLRGYNPDLARFLAWAKIREKRLEDASETINQQFAADIALCAQANRFDFSMAVRREAGTLVLEKVVDNH